MGNTHSSTTINSAPEDAGDETFEYDYNIEGGPAFAEAVVTLKPGQSILLEGGAMQYMLGPVEHKGIKMQGLKSTFMRSLAGESALMNKYFVPPAPANSLPGTIAFATAYPGDIVAVPLAANEPWYVMNGGFLGSTPNVRISGSLKVMSAINPFSQKDAVPTTMTCEGASGTVFLASYGSHRMHVLKEGEVLKVDSGLFLACKADVKYETVKMGKSLISSFLGGEGLGLMFQGPATVYTQSRNFSDLVAIIAEKVSKRQDGGGASSPAASPKSAKINNNNKNNNKRSKTKGTKKKVIK